MSNESKSRSICLVKFCKNIGNHYFPGNETLKLQWIQAIEYFKPGLSVRKYSKICSSHFKSADFHRTPLSILQPDLAPKRLKNTAVPSIFPWTTIKAAETITSEDQAAPAVNVNEIKKTYARTPQTAFVEEQPFLNIELNDFSEDPLKINEENLTPEVEQLMQDDIDNPQKMEIEELEITDEIEIAHDISIPKDIIQKSSQCHTEKHELAVQTQDDRILSIHFIRNNDKTVHFYTGLANFNKMLFVYHTLGECANKLSYFYGKPPKHLDTIDQFFITLMILRRHNPFEDIGRLFSTTVKQVSNIFVTWVRFMSLQWQNVDLWIDKESVKTYMPLDFHDKFPSTRVILDATECPIKKPKLPFAQQVTFSSYKNKNTVKFIVGIAPSGLISYVSPCYGGSATDRQIIERSSILNKFDYNDEIMVDKGLNVQDIFMPYGVKVNMPSFFKKGQQIGPQSLTSNRKVASKRVHVERVIGLLKTYKILTQPMNQTEILLSSDIVFICVMLVNFRSSIINKNA